MSKRQEIIEEARKYIDAVRHFDDASNYINSVRRLGVARLLNAASRDEREQISEEQQANIRRSISEAQRRISPPIIALNELTGDLDEPIYFEHEGRELMVVPHDYTSYSYMKCDIRPRDGGPETSL